MDNSKSDKVKFFPIYIVDAFTKHPFCGNPAAVCLLPFDDDADNDIKQRIASEMNLSETAFLKPIMESDTFQSGKRFSLDWFTPLCQVPLCGHATLASAAVLFMEYGNESEILEFETVSGILKAQKVAFDRIQIDLPAYESHPVHDKYRTVVEAAVKNLPVQEVVLSLSKKLLIRLSDDVTRKQLESIQTNDAELLAAAPDIAGLIVTLKGSSDECIDEDGNMYDFVSRYFSPWFGISEDPVTGAAHAVLAPYWANILQKNNLYARQCSRRGGELHIEFQKSRVLIGGNASIVVKGQIHI
ncbi:phenazine biosynthesis-like domain-containing protein isoform X2 [Argiope bruennichi]|uniref:phenazine biosynthesis-like domain-containing protein isoform X2 n=1 Tax=Argiope bruennichi TaxID=94029 RepID=UPI002495440B|nr:phenazine biosynthesis-like domain-containing protein isoform X2 [Argiope bruennichi]